MLNSKALTKIQSIIVIAVIVVAAVGGAGAYVLLNEEEQSFETIKIGVCADLDHMGRGTWQGVVFAVEQINAEGGVLGQQVEIIAEEDGKDVRLAIRGEGEIIGEMAIFEREVRSATVRALGKVRVLTVDERNFLRRIHEDSSLAYRIVQTMSRRIRELSIEVAKLKRGD